MSGCGDRHYRACGAAALAGPRRSGQMSPDRSGPWVRRFDLRHPHLPGWLVGLRIAALEVSPTALTPRAEPRPRARRLLGKVRREHVGLLGELLLPPTTRGPVS